jgi:hypothetical protein
MMVTSEHVLTEARAELMQLKAEAVRVSMSWRNTTEPTTPGHKAVRLMRARNRVEHAVAALTLAKSDEGLHEDGYNAEYRAISDAAAELVAAQGAWDLHKATKADVAVQA